MNDHRAGTRRHKKAKEDAETVCRFYFGRRDGAPSNSWARRSLEHERDVRRGYAFASFSHASYPRAAASNTQSLFKQKSPTPLRLVPHIQPFPSNPCFPQSSLVFYVRSWCWVGAQPSPFWLYFPRNAKGIQTLNLGAHLFNIDGTSRRAGRMRTSQHMLQFSAVFSTFPFKRRTKRTYFYNLEKGKL